MCLNVLVVIVDDSLVAGCIKGLLASGIPDLAVLESTDRALSPSGIEV